MSVSRPVKAEQPSKRAPFVDSKSGCVTDYGHRLLQALFNRSGGFNDDLADLLFPSVLGELSALDIQDRVAALEQASGNAILLSRIAETDEGLEALRRVLRGDTPFTGLNIAGTNVRPFLDYTDGTQLTDPAGLSDAVVETPAIVANGVTQSVAAYTASALTLTGTTAITIQSVSVTTDGEPVDLSCRFLLEVENPATFGMVFRIWRDAGGSPFTIFQEIVGNLAFMDAGGNYRFGQPYTAEWTDQPSAGTYNYFIQTEFTINTGFSIQEASNRYLKALRRLR